MLLLLIILFNSIGLIVVLPTPVLAPRALTTALLQSLCDKMLAGEDWDESDLD